ncbi:thiosulfate dehydrogenase [quinone] large subunit [Scopulibacillus darangshiensis]|uniref:Thiosulfate dehydrogenase [quinone] large subunit n=1 Tax=Scopulibacillus darangshiensis TaxID=442528 RepID=A0A4R2P8G1_9BACL|nr:DoxX family protein [Scopulibacillus darangshiensis]TCP31243.1 thiosulfate dehydrogenase [quinone] large subunit [Scopulibacillus darangshiensis]
MGKWLKDNIYASCILAVLRLYIGYQWIQAGLGKLSGGFDAGGFLHGAVTQATGEHPSVQTWWAEFLNGFALPNIGLFNVLVPWGEFLVGLGLVLGTFTTLSAFLGLAMNFAYMFSGATSTNPQMVIFELIIIIAGFNSARIGLDRWIMPFLRMRVFSKNEQQMQKNTVA